MEERNALWKIERRSGTFQLGREEGRLEGRRTALIELILEVLDARDIPVNPASAARIRAETELRTLKRWAIAASKVTRVSQLFAR